MLSSSDICNALVDAFGQLIVVMFLTYSGYGIMESVKRKGNGYVNGFMRKRVLKTLVHFDIAVALFLIVALWFEHEYAPINYILCWTGWLSIGNSNWFVFDIIVLYILAYGTLLVVRRRGGSLRLYAWGMMAVSAVFFAVMYKAKPGESWWCDTVLSFPVGMLWSLYREQLEKTLANQRRYVLVFIATVLLFVASYWAGRHVMMIFGAVNSMFFALLVILITMRLRIGNPILNWLGVNAFAIYILQRIPMIIAREAGFHEMPLFFASVVIPATLLIAALFTAATNRIDLKYFR